MTIPDEARQCLRNLLWSVDRELNSELDETLAELGPLLARAAVVQELRDMADDLEAFAQTDHDGDVYEAVVVRLRERADTLEAQ